MLHHQLLKEDGILVLHPEGSLQSEDFKAVAEEVDPFIEQNGKLNGMLIEAKAFPGWKDFNSFVSHMEFVRDHHKKIKRIAMVSDAGLAKIAPNIASHFVAAEVKQFPAAEHDAAIAWLHQSA